jgi:predicted PurR-regulated permease PerM
MEKNSFWKKWIYWFTFAVAVITVYKTLDNFTEITDWLKNLISLLMPFLLAILVAYLFYIPCRNVEQMYRKSKVKLIAKKARLISVFTVYIIALIVIIIITNFVLPAISKSLVDLANNLPNYYKNTIEYLNAQPEDSIYRQINAVEIVKGLEQIDISTIFSFDNIMEYIKGAIGVVNVLFAAFVTIIVSIYILLERGDILKFVKTLAEATFTPKTCESLGRYFTKTNEIFFKFISSQIFDGFVVGVILSIAMLLLGVKYAVLLGFIIGLFNIIPYFGAIVAVAIAIIITLFTGGLTQALWTAIVTIILQQIDANIINPKIVGGSLRLSPILVIFAVTIGGAYFGILGMFLAVPVITVLKLLIGDYIEYRKKIKMIENM